MKKFYTIGVLLWLVVAIAFAAQPTKTVLDATYTWGKKIRFEGQSDGGATFGKFNKVHSDSMIGIADTRTLFSNFVPKPGWEYILCRDTLGSYVHSKRDTSNIIVQLYAYASDTNGTNRLIGKLKVDSMGGLTAATGAGASPQQILLPFGQTICGDKYTCKLEASTAKDSVWINFFYLLQRSTTVNPKGQ
jgi:hypothetical protein